MDTVKVTATVLRKEYYHIELTVPEWYDYDDVEGAIRDKYNELIMEDKISPMGEEEEVWDIHEETVNE